MADGFPITQGVVSEYVREAGRAANLPESGAHRLRHTFCAHLVTPGAPPRAIQELAGHQELMTTQRYMHLSATAVENAIRLFEQCNRRPRGDIPETRRRRIPGPGRCQR